MWKNLKIWRKGDVINIQVLPLYVYDIDLSRQTQEQWIRHMRDKRWWSKELESKFIELANEKD